MLWTRSGLAPWPYHYFHYCSLPTSYLLLVLSKYRSNIMLITWSHPATNLLIPCISIYVSNSTPSSSFELHYLIHFCVWNNAMLNIIYLVLYIPFCASYSVKLYCIHPLLQKTQNSLKLITDRRMDRMTDWSHLKYLVFRTFIDLLNPFRLAMKWVGQVWPMWFLGTPWSPESSRHWYSLPELTINDTFSTHQWFNIWGLFILIPNKYYTYQRFMTQKMMESSCWKLNGKDETE